MAVSKSLKPNTTRIYIFVTSLNLSETFFINTLLIISVRNLNVNLRFNLRSWVYARESPFYWNWNLLRENYTFSSDNRTKSSPFCWASKTPKEDLHLIRSSAKHYSLTGRAELVCQQLSLLFFTKRTLIWYISLLVILLYAIVAKCYFKLYFFNCHLR